MKNIIKHTKVVHCEDGINNNNRHYVELPDGYRLIYDNNGYVGRYTPELDKVI